MNTEKLKQYRQEALNDINQKIEQGERTKNMLETKMNQSLPTGYGIYLIFCTVSIIFGFIMFVSLFAGSRTGSMNIYQLTAETAAIVIFELFSVSNLIRVLASRMFYQNLSKGMKDIQDVLQDLNKRAEYLQSDTPKTALIEMADPGPVLSETEKMVSQNRNSTEFLDRMIAILFGSGIYSAGIAQIMMMHPYLERFADTLVGFDIGVLLVILEACGALIFPYCAIHYLRESRKHTVTILSVLWIIAAAAAVCAAADGTAGLIVLAIALIVKIVTAVISWIAAILQFLFGGFVLILILLGLIAD